MSLDPTFSERNNNAATDFPTEQAQVTWNADVDHAEIANKRTHTSTALYPIARGPGATDSIYMYDICWSYKANYNFAQTPKRGNIVVTSSLNGSFTKGQSLMEIYNSIQYAGISKGEARIDARENNFEGIGVALATHGSYQIKNGPEHIESGDWLMMTLPDPNDPLVSEQRGMEGRITPYVTPYRPQDMGDKSHAILASNLHHFVERRKKPRSKKYEDLDRNIVSDGALMLRQGSLQSGLVLVHALLEAGILKVNEDFLDPEVDGFGAAQAQEHKDQYELIKLQTLTKLHDILNISDHQNNGEARSTFTVPHGRNFVPLDELVDAYLFEPTKHQIFERHIVKGEDYEIKKIIMEDQLTAIERTIKATEFVNSHFTDRIFAKSMCAAAPFEKVPVMLTVGRIAPY